MSKPVKFVRNTPEEEEAIARGIAADPDTHELTDEEMARMVPFPEWIEKTYGRPMFVRPKAVNALSGDPSATSYTRARPGRNAR